MLPCNSLRRIFQQSDTLCFVVAVNLIIRGLGTEQSFVPIRSGKMEIWSSEDMLGVQFDHEADNRSFQGNLYHYNHMSCLPAFSILQQFYNGLPSSSFHFSQSLQLEASLLDSSSNCWGSGKEQHGETATSQLSDGKSTTPKSSAELVKEISMLDIEIEHLERYLLSLYRNAFQQHLPSVKGNHEICVQQISGPSPVVTFDKASQEKKLGMRKDLYDHQDQSSPTSA